MIDEMTKKVPTIRYIGWELSITDKGPVLVEQSFTRFTNNPDALSWR
jgi:hypothetical protein